MIGLPSSVRIFLSVEAVDCRKGFDGLQAIVKRLEQNVYSGHLFVFVSKRGDRIKILTWDNGGFVLWYNHLSSHCTSFCFREGFCVFVCPCIHF